MSISSNYLNENDFQNHDKDLGTYIGYDPDGINPIEANAELERQVPPAVQEAFVQYMDIGDIMTRRAITYMNEADQASVLASLTAKLYDKIVTKVDDIDYGDIPNSKGDITKLPSYEKLRECIDLLRSILKEFKQDTSPVEVLSVAMANVMTRKDLFGRAFKYKCEMPIIMYNNTVLSIVNGVSYMIATCIEFIKTPNSDSFQVTLDKVALNKTKNNMLYTNLKRFNKICEDGKFDKVMEEVIQAHIRGGKNEAAVNEAIGLGALAAGAAKVGAWLTGGPAGWIILGISALVLLITAVIPLLRDMVFLFYYARVRVSDFFDIQADLLQMNTFKLQNDPTVSADEKERIINKQMKHVDLFRKIANKISYTNKEAEVKATREITADSKKMKLSDVSDEIPDSVSALF